MRRRSFNGRVKKKIATAEDFLERHVDDMAFFLTSLSPRCKLVSVKYLARTWVKTGETPALSRNGKFRCLNKPDPRSCHATSFAFAERFYGNTPPFRAAIAAFLL